MSCVYEVGGATRQVVVRLDQSPRHCPRNIAVRTTGTLEPASACWWRMMSFARFRTRDLKRRV